MRYLLTQINSCEVCANSDLKESLNLGLHPLCDDLKVIGDLDRCSEFPIEILFCEVCKTAHQKYQVKKSLLFPETYHYRARFTADVLNGMADLVAAVEGLLSGSIEGKTVLDVGCNDGSLLNIFSERGTKTIGIEPTGAANDANHDLHEIHEAYFEPEIANKIKSTHGFPDIITFTNVFAHIEDLRLLLESLRILIGDNTLLIIENHYLGAVIDGNQFDTFYHEHPRTYSVNSFLHISNALSANVIDVHFPNRYGGNIRVCLSKNEALVPTDNILHDILKLETGFGRALSDMSLFVEEWKLRTQKQIAELVRIHGPLSAKAFPGRAAILVRILGLDENQISGVYERSGSIKVGHYLPGTKIPILDEADLDLENLNSPLINLAWHISEEIESYMRSKGFDGKIIDIM